MEEDYGDELEEQVSYDDEVEIESESEDELVEKTKKKKGKKDNKIKARTAYASYEEFAHLLEEGIDNENAKDKKHFSNAIKSAVGQKRNMP